VGWVAKGGVLVVGVWGVELEGGREEGGGGRGRGGYHVCSGWSEFVDWGCLRALALS